MNCSVCEQQMQPKPVPGAIRFPRRMECPTHGYSLREYHPTIEEVTPDEESLAVFEELRGTDDNGIE
jgi:hypothetical protein